ncbi:MAG: SMP-30/Gluconolaconase/LRE-like region [Methanosaeta sp. PtaU1.Bin060]|nr:MAG: SMP-30/Gluconolaconase/LRE-like region [Methanosaeta sp. PtaU1.Bin060]
MNAKIPILLIICLLASVVPVYCASLSNQWAVEDKADGIAIGPGGEVYVNINQNHRVVKYSPEGEMLMEWSLEGVADDIAVGPGGEVYVNINQNHRVVKYSPEGVMLDGWTVEGEMTDMAIGSNGLVYLSFTNGLIQVFVA